VESVVVFTFKQFDADRRIDRDQLAALRVPGPFEKARRIDLRKLFAACGAAARRSRPALIVSTVMSRNNSPPAVCETRRRPKRCRRLVRSQASQKGVAGNVDRDQLGL
jgi:hypothetical protein